MRFEPFLLERFQSRWENQVAIDLATSGIAPARLVDFLEPDEIAQLHSLPLGYPPTRGSQPLREAIAGLYPDCSADNVLVTCGTAEANFLAAMFLTEPGDEAAVMLPTYLQIPGLLASLQTQVRPFWLEFSEEWSMNQQQLSDAVTAGTRLVAVCNPNNPTGRPVSDHERSLLIELARARDAWLLVDEVFSNLEIDGVPTPSFWRQHEKTIVTGGLSKAYGLAGLRVGWVIAPEECVEEIWGLRDYTTIAVSATSDFLACLALQPQGRAALLGRTRRILESNFPLVAEWAETLPGKVELVAPRAGAFAFPRIHANLSSQEICHRLREHHGVLMVPGSLFGVDQHLRIGFGGNTGELVEGIEKLAALLCRA